MENPIGIWYQKRKLGVPSSQKSLEEECMTWLVGLPKRLRVIGYNYIRRSSRKRETFCGWREFGVNL